MRTPARVVCMSSCGMHPAFPLGDSCRLAVRLVVPLLGLGDGGADVLRVRFEHAVPFEDINLHEGITEGRGAVQHLLLGGGGLSLLLAEGGGDGVGFHDDREGLEEGGDAVPFFSGDVHVGGEELAEARRLGQEVGQFLSEVVSSWPVVAGEVTKRSASEIHEEAHGAAEGGREVCGRVPEGALGLVLQGKHGMLRSSLQPFDAFALLVVPEHGMAEVDGSDRIREAAEEELFELQAASEEQSQVRSVGKVGGETEHLLLVVGDHAAAILVRSRGAECGRKGAGDASHDGHSEGGGSVANHVEELVAEDDGGVRSVRAQGLHEGNHVGVAPGDALPHDLEGARHDVGAFDGDGDRHGHVHISSEVAGSSADPCASQNVHAVRHDAAPTLGTALLHDT
mmetsp:Transcript_14905/g.21684  ORF Transcript_14905/g.21684 Transcript_14905/m.21684 type:complete len:397 (+) Transcript_14905:273-1463(+)